MFFRYLGCDVGQVVGYERLELRGEVQVYDKYLGIVRVLMIFNIMRLGEIINEVIIDEKEKMFEI